MEQNDSEDKRHWLWHRLCQLWHWLLSSRPVELLRRVILESLVVIVMMFGIFFRAFRAATHSHISFSISLCKFLGALLLNGLSAFLMCIVLFLAADKQRVLSWIVFFLGPIAAFGWSTYWLRQKKTEASNRWIPKNQFFPFYVTITLVVMVTLYAAAYKASSSIGGELVQQDSNKKILSSKTYEFLHFSLVTASTLGDSNIFAKGKARLLVGLQILHFWILIIVMGVLMQDVCPKIEFCPLKDV